VFVRAKFAAVLTPGAVAVTVYDPAVPFAVTTSVVACPFALVALVVLVSVALAPAAGTVNVTVTFRRGFPQLSVTVATSGFANSALITALCGVPLVVAIFAAVPAG
jgi:hypothetical protein